MTLVYARILETYTLFEPLYTAGTNVVSITKVFIRKNGEQVQKWAFKNVYVSVAR